MSQLVSKKVWLEEKKKGERLKMSPVIIPDKTRTYKCGELNVEVIFPSNRGRNLQKALTIIYENGRYLKSK